MTKLVRDAGDERRFGADDDELRRQRHREPEQAVAVVGANRVAPAEAGDAGIAGGGVQLGQRRALRESPGERVLARAGADEEDAHAASLLRGFRAHPHGHDRPEMQEPGLDRHEWESEWSDLEERLRDDPSDALLELDELVARMLQAQRVPLRERDGQTETEPETTRGFAEAHRITELVGAGEDVDPGDIADAVNQYRELYETLLERSLD